jgi:hypothetical protein
MAELSLHLYSEEDYQKKVESAESPLNDKQKQVLKTVLAILDNLDNNKGLQSEFKVGLLDKVTKNPDMLDQLLANIETIMLAKLQEVEKQFKIDGNSDEAKSKSRKIIHQYIHMGLTAQQSSLN